MLLVVPLFIYTCFASCDNVIYCFQFFSSVFLCTFHYFIPLFIIVIVLVAVAVAAMAHILHYQNANLTKGENGRGDKNTLNK